MKSGKVLILIVTLVTCLHTGCNSDTNRSSNNTDVEKDTLSDQMDQDDGIAEYESADRVIWQKPDLVIDQLGEVQGKVVVDLGAGTGYFSRRIAYKGAKVIAIDIDPRAIQWMEAQKAKFPVELQDRLVIRQADVDDPHLEPNEVDIILLVNTYTYIGDRVTYFHNLRPALRRGGLVVIIDFKKKETPFGPPIENRLDIRTVEQELIEAGYEILRTDEESLDYQYIIKARRAG